ncbi:class I SAM-dependent methyltransferase [Streptomyces mobaraensis]|uniref:Class I SAM-dependent methyltransferase n=1 Tax=Streptomyces mobaraensis TaxID=35621 RepID=A0A5N5W2M1_STRMB|nr:class I SAM-dependent methyltransferase [Streptomyces mobaraensis]KAB7835525.1 class I SAM-dependent methyltransferase [Streptomyces mobaraensis]
MNRIQQGVDPWRHHGQMRALAEAAHSAADSFHWDLYDSYGLGPEVLGPLAGRDVVDIGSGTGQCIAHLVQEHGARGTGVDSSPAMTELATDRYGATGHLTYRTADAPRYLAQNAASFDVCLSRFGAACFTEPHLLLAAAAMALRPDGLLVLATMAEHADHQPATAHCQPSPCRLVQEDGSVRMVARWVLAESRWRQLLGTYFDVLDVERLANPRHPGRAVATYLIRARRTRTPTCDRTASPPPLMSVPLHRKPGS